MKKTGQPCTKLASKEKTLENSIKKRTRGNGYRGVARGQGSLIMTLDTIHSVVCILNTEERLWIRVSPLVHGHAFHRISPPYFVILQFFTHPLATAQTRRSSTNRCYFHALSTTWYKYRTKRPTGTARLVVVACRYAGTVTPSGWDILSTLSQGGVVEK